MSVSSNTENDVSIQTTAKTAITKINITSCRSQSPQVKIQCCAQVTQQRLNFRTHCTIPYALDDCSKEMHLTAAGAPSVSHTSLSGTPEGFPKKPDRC